MRIAKELQVSKWLNAPPGFNLDLKSPQIKVIHAFQMLCPGCVYRAIPQAIELHELMKGEPVQVLGLHTVFENHFAMTPEALEVFIKEWHLPFPVGVDRHNEKDWMPETMRAYQMQGTPTTIVIDHLGELKLQHFGHVDTEKLLVFLKELKSAL